MKTENKLGCEYISEAEGRKVSSNYLSRLSELNEKAKAMSNLPNKRIHVDGTYPIQPVKTLDTNNGSALQQESVYGNFASSNPMLDPFKIQEIASPMNDTSVASPSYGFVSQAQAAYDEFPQSVSKMKLYPTTRPILHFGIGGAANVIYKVQMTRDWGGTWQDISTLLRQPSVGGSPYYEIDVTTIVNSHINHFIPMSLAKNYALTAAKQNYNGGMWFVRNGSLEIGILCTGEAYGTDGLLTYDPNEENWIRMATGSDYIDAIVQGHETAYKHQKRWLEDYNFELATYDYTRIGRWLKFLTNRPTQKVGAIKECAGFDDYVCIFHDARFGNNICMWAYITNVNGASHWMPISNASRMYTKSEKYLVYDVGLNWIQFIINNGYAYCGISNSYTTLPSIANFITIPIAKYTVHLARATSNPNNSSQDPNSISRRFSEKIEYKIVENNCCGKGFQRLFWKNQKGGLDGITFMGAKEQMTTTSNEIWETALGHRESDDESMPSATGNPFAIINKFGQRKHQKQKININHSESERLVSQWFNKKELEWVKEIVTSPYVWKVKDEDKHWTNQYNRDTRVPVLVTSAEIVWKPMDENLARIELVYNEIKQVTQR